MNSRPYLCAPILALIFAIASPIADAAAAPVSRRDQDVAHAQKVLPAAQQGRKALKTMDAGQEATAAERNHRSADSFRKLLESDPTVWVNSKGLLFYVEHAEASDEAVAQDNAPVSGEWVTYPDSQALQLHSKAGSQHTIYLDFDGYTLAPGAAWTDRSVNGEIIPAGTYGGFTLDSSGSFSSAEMAYIQTVWRIVSEKFAPFDIDVTTEAPSSAALNRSSSSDLSYGTRVVITNNMAARGNVCTATSSGGCLGVAWIDVFNAVGDYGYGVDGMEPAWVYTRFTNSSPVRSAGSVANVAAHEAGHTLALVHDSSGGCGGYYSGHDNWFPIMGSSSRAVGHFTNGSSFAGEATTCQTDPLTGTPNPNDVDVIGKAGAPLRADDFAGTKALGEATGYRVDGIIERASDTDTFSVQRTCSGQLTATASGIGVGQALDLKVTIRNPSGTTVAAVAPSTSASTSTTPNTPINMDAAAVATNAGSGLWTITVEGVGLGNPLTTGYSDYGSLGMYRLDIGGCPNGTPGAYSSLSPQRLLDTRNGIGAPRAQVGPGQAVTFQVAGRGGVPASDVSAAILNLTATNGTRPGVITAYPAGISRPTASNVSYGAGQTVATHATVKLGDAGRVTLYNASSGPVHLIADVSGWYQGGTVSQPGMFTPVVPARLASVLAILPNATIPVGVTGRGGVPSSGVGAGAFNVTVSGATLAGFVTVFPNGTTRPNASNLNFLLGQTVANATSTRLVDGNLALFNGSLGITQITADVNGWFSDGVGTAPGSYNSLNPSRILDTRNGIGVSRAQVPAGGTVTLTVAGSGGVPSSGANAAVMNVTVTNARAAGYVTAYPTGSARPNASNVNFRAWQTIPNLVTVKLGGGKVTFYNGATGAVDIVADVAGWYHG
ncbi:MAG TPA: M12 family metallo-peptidase [Aeromicrobium sp.]|nr:M12 family metallo-peptidase [Aeromicrobium sp.]